MLRFNARVNIALHVVEIAVHCGEGLVSAWVKVPRLSWDSKPPDASDRASRVTSRTVVMSDTAFFSHGWIEKRLKYGSGKPLSSWSGRVRLRTSNCNYIIFWRRQAQDCAIKDAAETRWQAACSRGRIPSKVMAGKRLW